MGDRLLLYTDGLLDAENAAGESFGDAALATFIKERQESGAEHFVDLLLNWTPVVALVVGAIVYASHRQALYDALPILLLWA